MVVVVVVWGVRLWKDCREGDLDVLGSLLVSCATVKWGEGGDGRSVHCSSDDGML